MVRRIWEPNPETIFDDLMRLASGVRRRNDPMTLADVDKVRAGKARAKAKRTAVKRAEMAAAKAERAARYKPKPDSVWIRLLLAMRPGEWHGAGDLVRAAGVSRRNKFRMVDTLQARGLVESVDNPAWSSAPVAPWRIIGGEVREPKRLYRLTAAGEARRCDALARQTPDKIHALQCFSR